MKAIGGKLRRQEKVKQGNLLNWIKSKIVVKKIFFTGGCRIVNIEHNLVYRVMQVKDRNDVVVLPRACGVYLWRFEEIILTF